MCDIIVGQKESLEEEKAPINRSTTVRHSPTPTTTSRGLTLQCASLSSFQRRLTGDFSESLFLGCAHKIP